MNELFIYNWQDLNKNNFFRRPTIIPKLNKHKNTAQIINKVAIKVQIKMISVTLSAIKILKINNISRRTNEKFDTEKSEGRRCSGGGIGNQCKPSAN
jgi:hypothetical protein